MPSNNTDKKRWLLNDFELNGGNDQCKGAAGTQDVNQTRQGKYLLEFHLSKLESLRVLDQQSTKWNQWCRTHLQVPAIKAHEGPEQEGTSGQQNLRQRPQLCQSLALHQPRHDTEPVAMQFGGTIAIS